MDRQPFVSVVVTTFNQASFIGPALDSVFRQTYSQYEVIVVDDGSTDDTPSVLARFEPRIIHVRQTNQGVAGARNRGVKEARGDLVAFLDGDDLWESDKLAHQVAAAVADQRSGLVVTDGVQFDGTRTIDEFLIGPSERKFLDGSGGVTVIDGAYERLLAGNFIASVSQVMIPRTVLESIGPSDVSFGLVSDWDLYLRISRQYPVSLIGRKLVRWRYLSSSASGPESLRRLRWGLEGVDLLQKHSVLCPPNLRAFLRTRRRIYAFAVAQGAYVYGTEIDRGVAAKILRRLLLKPYAALPAASFLLALYAPRVVTASLGPAVRALLNVRSPNRE